MKPKLYFYIFFLALLNLLFIPLVGCKQSQNSKYNVTIDLDNTEGKHIADFVIEKVISLETNEKSLIGSIDVVREHNGKFYIQDRMRANALFAFDSVGRLINRTIIGKGPGELTVRIECFSIETKKGNDLISIFDQSGYFKYYDTNLNFTGLKRNGGMIFNTAYIALDDSTVLVYSRSPNTFEVVPENNPNKYIYYTYHLYDTCFTEIKRSLLPISKGFGGWGLYTPFSSYSDRILLTRPADNYIYELVGYETFPLLFVDFGKYKITTTDIEMNEKKDDYFWDLFIKGERASMFTVIEEIDEFIAFSFVFKRRPFKYFLNKKNGEIYGDLNFNFPFSQKVLLAGKTGDNKFIGIVKAIDLKEYYNNVLHSHQFDHLDEGNNDCLVLFTIKDKHK
jgi:hypothetical protein